MHQIPSYFLLRQVPSLIPVCPHLQAPVKLDMSEQLTTALFKILDLQQDWARVRTWAGAMRQCNSCKRDY